MHLRMLYNKEVGEGCWLAQRYINDHKFFVYEQNVLDALIHDGNTSYITVAWAPMNRLSAVIDPMTKKRILHCEFCFKTFTRPSALRPHRYTHTGEKPFACHVPGCGRRFTVISNLRRHYKVHERRQFQPVFATYGELSAFLFAYLSQQQQQQQHPPHPPHPQHQVGTYSSGMPTDNTTATAHPSQSSHPPHPTAAGPCVPSSNGYPFSSINNVPTSACFSPVSSTTSSAPSLVNTPIPPNIPRRESLPYHHQHQVVCTSSCTASLLPESPPPGLLEDQRQTLQQQQVASVPLTAISSVSSIGSTSTASNSPPLPIIPPALSNHNSTNMDSTSSPSIPFQRQQQYALSHHNNNKAPNTISEKPMLDNEELMSWILSQQQQQKQQDTPLYYDDPNTTMYPNFYYSQ